MTAPVDTPETAAAASPPPRPVAFFLQAPGRTLGPLTRDELLGYFGAGLVAHDAHIIGPEWNGAFTAGAAAEWLGVTLRGAVAPAGPRDPASLPPLAPAPLEYRRAGLGWRVAALWIVALLAVQMAIVPARSIDGQPDLAGFVLAVAWRFALVALPCWLIVAGGHRVMRGLWPSARGPLLAASAVYAVLAVQFLLQPAAPVATAPVQVAAASASTTDVPVVTEEDPTDAWAREEFAAFDAQLQAEQAAVATPSTPVPAGAPEVASTPAAGADSARSATVDPDPRHTRAHALHAARDWKVLQDHATQWTGEQPHRYEAWQYLGIAQYELGQRGAAVGSFEQALAAGSKDPSTLRALAGSYLDAGRHREAADMSQRVIDAEPDLAYGWLIQGRAMSALGEYDEAVAALEHAIKLRPNVRYYYGVLAQIHFRGGFADRGKAAVDKANDLL